MQSQTPTPRTPGVVEHPEAAEWMALLYDELAPERKRELRAHLGQCPACASQVRAWRASQADLEQWSLPAVRPARHQWAPVLRWAPAAALVLAFGFVLGRQTLPAARDLAALKAEVAQLSQEAQQERAAHASQSAALATAVAHNETVRVLAEYSRLQDEQRAADQQTVKLALDGFDARLAGLRTGLETVAVNTETGFQQTHQNLTRLASYSVPAASRVTP
jgi:anti-sigma factor RsiW